MNELAGIFKDTRKHLMNGVSHMIPFVVTGGILMAVAVMAYGQGGVPPEGTWMATLWNFGSTALNLMVPVLSAYIAASIADRAGICPGFVGGMISISVGAGFLGGIVTGLLGGIVCYYLKKVKVPKALSSIMPIMIIPIVGSLVTMGFMQYVLGAPIAGIMDGMTKVMEHLGNGNKVILGAVCGLLAGFDFGGPFNKVAYTFGVATVSAGVYTYAGPMAVTMTAPPLGCALAAFLAKKKFTQEEREAAKSAVAMGCVGITEGAIPFAANDPLRVIPSTMIGAAAGGAVGYLFNITNTVAWSGLIMIPVLGNPIGFLVSLAIAVGVTAGLMILLKKDITEEAAGTDEGDLDIDLSFE